MSAVLREKLANDKLLDPAVRQQLVDQLAEQNRQAAIANLQTKSGILVAMFMLALTELWLGTVMWVGHVCEPSQHWWLVTDGAVTGVGMLFGLIASLKRIQVAQSIEAKHWVLANGEERDTSGDLTGVFRIIHTLSDGLDVLMLLLFCYGWVCFYRSGGDECDTAMPSLVWWGLVSKPLAPVAMSLAIKALFALRGDQHSRIAGRTATRRLDGRASGKKKSS
jgi:hypothetical protein